MKQILIIFILCITINDMMGASLGWGIVVANCPAVEVDQDGEVSCIYIVDGYIQIELRINDSNHVPGIYDTHKVDFSSIDGFTDHGIPSGK